MSQMSMTLAEWANFNKMNKTDLEQAIFSAAAVLGAGKLKEGEGSPQKTFQFDVGGGEIVLMTFHLPQ